MIGAGISRGFSERADRKQREADRSEMRNRFADEMALRNEQFISEENYRQDRASREDEYRRAVMDRDASREDRLTREGENEAAYRDKLLGLKREEMYGGREIPPQPDFSAEPTPEEMDRMIASGGTAGMPMTPGGFEPTVEATKTAALAGKSARSEGRADARLIGQLDERGRKIRAERIKTKAARLADRENQLKALLPDEAARALFLSVPKGEARKISGALRISPQGYTGTAPSDMKGIYALMDEIDALRADLDTERAMVGSEGFAIPEGDTGGDWIGDLEADEATED